MRAAVLDGFGDADALRLTEVPYPQRVLNEVLVRVVAAGVSPVDAATRSGGGAAAGIEAWPVVLGSGFSGVVVETPYEHHPLQPGDEVYGVSGAPRSGGSFAEFVAVPSTNLAQKPPVLSHAEAAAVPLAALTAWGAVVEMARAHDGQRILVLPGADGLGDLAVQVGAYFGASVVVAAQTHDAPRLRDLGAAEVVDPAGTSGNAGAQVDVVIDVSGAAAPDDTVAWLRMLRPGGLLVTVPGASAPALARAAEGAGVRATTYRVGPDAATLALIARLIVSGDLRVAVADVLPFERIADAHRAVEARHGRGEVVVQVAAY